VDAVIRAARWRPTLTEPFPKTPARNASSGPSAADDLFDVPVEALNLPGMDALDATAALAEFARAEPAIAALASEPVPIEEPVDESYASVEYAATEEYAADADAGAADEDWQELPPTAEGVPAPRLRRVWIALGAMVLGSALAFTLSLSKHSPAATAIPPTTAALPPSQPEVQHSPTAREPAPHEPTAHEPSAQEVHVGLHETMPPVNTAVQADEPTAPKVETSAAAPIASALHGEPHTSLPETAVPAPSAKREVPVSVAERDISAPPATRSGRVRLQAVESALENGRRAYARREIGRILLDVDALPEAEREETRAQAELLVARILQETADEARRAAR
jgi:hypothetical protein